MHLHLGRTRTFIWATLSRCSGWSSRGRNVFFLFSFFFAPFLRATCQSHTVNTVKLLLQMGCRLGWHAQLELKWQMACGANTAGRCTGLSHADRGQNSPEKKAKSRSRRRRKIFVLCTLHSWSLDATYHEPNRSCAIKRCPSVYGERDFLLADWPKCNTPAVVGLEVAICK